MSSPWVKLANHCDKSMENTHIVPADMQVPSAILTIQWNLHQKSLRPSHTSAYTGSAIGSWLAE